MTKKNTLLYIGVPVAIIIIVADISIINKRNVPLMTATKGQPAPAARDLEPIKPAEVGDLVVVNYIGTLENGTKFDSSYDAGQPFGFLIGQQMVIKGWDEELLGMKRGEKKHLVLPPERAYGDQEIKGQDGKVLIPKNSTLIFDIEIVEVMAKVKVDALIKERQQAQAAASSAQAPTTVTATSGQVVNVKK